MKGLVQDVQHVRKNERGRAAAVPESKQKLCSLCVLHSDIIIKEACSVNVCTVSLGVKKSTD